VTQAPGRNRPRTWRRLPESVFAVLVLATVAAFFITQHIKVTLPLINGDPLPLPAAFNPRSGRSGAGEPLACEHRRTLPDGRPGPLVALDYRRTFITFYLQAQPDRVTVQILNARGSVVRTLVRGYYMPTYRRNPAGKFAWDGRQRDGALAPAGVYRYRVVLQGLGRSVVINRPIRIIYAPPRPRILSITPLQARAGSPVRIEYADARGDAGEILLNRLLLFRAGRLAKAFQVRRASGVAAWNGLIAGAPAPAGRYSVALASIDTACNAGSYPARLPPAAGSAPAVSIVR
jgi:hypothetical protein